jgi:transcriptional regulator with XRE-family HTH domain
VEGGTVNRAGGLIAAARLKRHLTQTRLAELAGTTQPTISAYERGAKVPDLVTLERILGAAGFELRMSLAKLDDHDSSLERYEKTLPRSTRARFADQQRTRKAPSARGRR